MYKLKKKLYCCIGGFVLAFPLIFYYTEENHMESGKMVSGVFREYSQEGLISYEMQKENVPEPVVSYIATERTLILDYKSQKEGQGSGYSSDLLLNIKKSTSKEDTVENKEENTKKESTKDNREDSAKKGNSKKESSDDKKNSDKKTKRKKKKSAKNKNEISLTKKEKEVLLRIVEAEATGEDVMGRMLVANVVLNRVKSSIFPNNVVDVVYANSDGIYQFSPISDGRFWQVSISSKTRRAVRRVLRGEDYSEGALFFMARRSARSSSVNWFETHLTMVKQYGGHEFYK